MLNLEVKTKLSQEEVTERIKRFFGKEGQGLRLSEETECCLSFEGGGGYVTAQVTAEEGTTRIDLLTQEWDFQVREFASRLPK
jgi:hypothetical protein